MTIEELQERVRVVILEMLAETQPGDPYLALFAIETGKLQAAAEYLADHPGARPRHRKP